MSRGFQIPSNTTHDLDGSKGNARSQEHADKGCRNLAGREVQSKTGLGGIFIEGIQFFSMGSCKLLPLICYGWFLGQSFLVLECPLGEGHLLNQLMHLLVTQHLP